VPVQSTCLSRPLQLSLPTKKDNKAIIFAIKYSTKFMIIDNVFCNRCNLKKIKRHMVPAVSVHLIEK